MDGMYVRAILAGVLFGIWPLLMNRSGLTGHLLSAVFALGVLMIVSPFAIYELRNGMAHATWYWAIAACAFGAAGLLIFSDIIAKSSSQTIGSLFVVMLIAQIATPAVYHVINSGGLTLRTALGFVAAILAAILLA